MKKLASYLKYFGASGAVIKIVEEQSISFNQLLLIVILPLALKIGMKIVYKTTPLNSNRNILNKNG